MDRILIDYLKSGRAWVLVESGPSSEMGYPTWRRLAESASQLVLAEARDANRSRLDSSLLRADYPLVFEEAQEILGLGRLLHYLDGQLRSNNRSRIYPLIARWPVPVYLTTNYDNEIQRHLAQLGEAYLDYGNTEDHLAHLLPDLRGAVFKLHGDLRSAAGLVLTTSQYSDISTGAAWKYWRTKLTSVFQMSRLVVIGHSLSDQNIKHVLAAAKDGAGALQPICWIAPDVSTDQARQYLEDYRIRVIPYDNRDGTHRNLVKLIGDISAFIPPRTTVQIQDQIRQVSQSPLGGNAGASGFFVFNKLASQDGFDNDRIEIVLAALESAVPLLSGSPAFSIFSALQVAGWPKDSPLPLSFSEQVEARAIDRGLLKKVTGGYALGDTAESLAKENKSKFEHTRERFLSSLQLRIRRGFPALGDEEARKVAVDIDASLTGYFREGGLSLASMLFSGGNGPRTIELPSSIIKFISESSARYSHLLQRQAFCSASVEAFIEAEDAERDYLGRLAQGFFAFHALGVFGDVAKERLDDARNTVWLMDSNALISAVAVGTATNAAFLDSFLRLKQAGVRLFTTEGLFEELWEHFGFAEKIVSTHGSDSPNVFYAARGESPYKQSNQFLDGFVRWQAIAGNKPDWKAFLYGAFGKHVVDRDLLKAKLAFLGVEVVSFQSWPGFSDLEFQARDHEKQRIIELRERTVTVSNQDFDLLSIDLPEKKAKPEAEALLIVKRERTGVFHMLVPKGQVSSAWFISNTSLLNADQATRITWRPDDFLSFSCSLPLVDGHASAERAFERVLWSIAQCGVSLLREDVVAKVFGGIIEQAGLSIQEQRELYKQTIEKKYGSMESVLSGVIPSRRPLVALQLAKEMAQAEAAKRAATEKAAEQAEERATSAEKKLREVERFRRKLERKKSNKRRK